MFSLKYNFVEYDTIQWHCVHRKWFCVLICPIFSGHLGHLCSVSSDGPGYQHPSDCAPVLMHGPSDAHGMVRRLSIHPLCYVQKGTSAGIPHCLFL